MYIMAPVWQEIRSTFQVYGESYFNAVESWKDYLDSEIMKNRLQLLETVCALFTRYACDDQTYSFNVVGVCNCTSSVKLMDEVIPSFGFELVAEGDRKVYEILLSKLPCELFKLGGLFFQEQLLFLIAGVNKRILAMSNKENRNAIIHVFNTVLRLPESFGLACITGQLTSTVVGRNQTQQSPSFIVPNKDLLSANGARLLAYLMQPEEEVSDSAVAATISFSASISLKRPSETVLANNNSSNKAAKVIASTGIATRNQRNRSKRLFATADSFDSSSDSSASPPSIQIKRPRSSSASSPVRSSYHLVPRIKWDTAHFSVGLRVAALRASLNINTSVTMNTLLNTVLCTSPSSNSTCSAPPGAIELRGTVVAHAVRCSEAAGVEEDIYRIQWADRALEMEIYTARQLHAAVALRDKLEGWVSVHPVIGSRVAGIFTTNRPVPLNNSSYTSTPYYTFTSKQSVTAAGMYFANGTYKVSQLANSSSQGTVAGASRSVVSLSSPAAGSRSHSSRAAGETAAGAVESSAGIFRGEEVGGSADIAGRVDSVQLSRNKVLYAGVVTKYLPASRGNFKGAHRNQHINIVSQNSQQQQQGKNKHRVNQRQDQLYHVEWCDGDREDLDESELQEALELYAHYRQLFEA